MPETSAHLRIQSWLEDALPPRPPVLEQIEASAGQFGVPISSPLVGRFVHQMLRSIGARRVFEFGTGVGYATVWMASATGTDGEVVSTDTDATRLDRARENVLRSGLGGRVTLRSGDGLSIFRSLPGPWDAVFVDFAKRLYPDALEAASEGLRKGGLLLADHIFWDGRGLDLNTLTDDPDISGLRTFTRRLLVRRDFLTSLVPLADGLAVALKTEG